MTPACPYFSIYSTLTPVAVFTHSLLRLTFIKINLFLTNWKYNLKRRLLYSYSKWSCKLSCYLQKSCKVDGAHYIIKKIMYLKYFFSKIKEINDKKYFRKIEKCYNAMVELRKCLRKFFLVYHTLINRFSVIFCLQYIMFQ